MESSVESFSDELYKIEYDMIPCEFCTELFPFELLIDHQLFTHFDEQQFSANDVDPVAAVAAAVKTDLQPSKSTKPEEINKNDFKEIVTVKDVHEEKPLIKEISTHKPAKEQIKADLKDKPVITDAFFEEPAFTFEDSISQESGTKLMAYGSNVNKTDRSEVEKPTFKVPLLPHMNNADRKETEDGYISLSDNEDGESLEDFWKRAEIKLSQQLRKTIKL